MPGRNEATFVVHGLDVDAKSVRAGAQVFARKLLTLIAGFREADRFVNGTIAYDYVISALTIGSASVSVREKQRSTRIRPHTSGIATYRDVASAIYNGDRSASNYPEPLIRRVGQLCKGALQSFSHGELSFGDDNVIRIDEFLERQTEAANQVMAAGEEGISDRYYRGRAIGSFDGELQEIDNRGMILRGKLLLTAGGIEIDCVMNKERVPEARDAFDKRVVIEGTAYYDGEQQLPVRIDVSTIRVVGGIPDLLRWRGAFAPAPQPDDAEDDWC